MPERIANFKETYEKALESFYDLAEILDRSPASSLEPIACLEEIAGGSEIYRGLVSAGEAFCANRPDIFHGKIASPETMALWIGLVVGASINRPEK